MKSGFLLSVHTNFFRILASVSLTVLFISAATGCRYKDGPKLTFRSAGKRIAQVWIIEKYQEDNTDKTSDFKNTFPDWNLDMTGENNAYTLVYSTSPWLVSESGSWELIENGTKLNLKKNKTGSNIWIINRLKTKSLWVEQTDGNGKKITYHLKKSN